MEEKWSRRGAEALSQKLIRIHIHGDDDILGEGELFQDPGQVPGEALDG